MNFTIRDALWLTVVVSLAVGWSIERSRRVAEYTSEVAKLREALGQLQTGGGGGFAGVRGRCVRRRPNDSYEAGSCRAVASRETGDESPMKHVALPLVAARACTRIRTYVQSAARRDAPLASQPCPSGGRGSRHVCDSSRGSCPSLCALAILVRRYRSGQPKLPAPVVADCWPCVH